MAPTSLGEGRGEVLVPALVVVFHLGIKRRLVDGWARSGSTSGRDGRPKCGNVPNADRRKGAILGGGAKRDFPSHANTSRADGKPGPKGKGGIGI